MLQGRVVKVRSVAADRYGRWVSTVTADGVDAGFVMVEEGEAWAYRTYLWALPKEARGRYLAAEARARRAGRGLWAERSPEASCSAFSTSSGGSDAPSGASSGASENRRLLQTFSHAGGASPFCGGALICRR